MEGPSVFYRFVDWTRAAENVLKWYEQALSAVARPGESWIDTEQRLLQLCDEAKREGRPMRLTEDGEKEGIGPAEGDRTLAACLPVFLEGWRRLPFKEQIVLREFYITPGEGKLDAVTRLSSVFHYERTRIYEMRRTALARFAFMLFRQG